MRQQVSRSENSLLRHLRKQDVEDKLLLGNTPPLLAAQA